MKNIFFFNYQITQNFAALPNFPLRAIAVVSHKSKYVPSHCAK